MKGFTDTLTKLEFGESRCIWPTKMALYCKAWKEMHLAFAGPCRNEAEGKSQLLPRYRHRYYTPHYSHSPIWNWCGMKLLSRLTMLFYTAVNSCITSQTQVKCFNGLLHWIACILQYIQSWMGYLKKENIKLLLLMQIKY